MSNKYNNILNLLLEKKYYISITRTKKTYLIEFPKNILLNLQPLKVYYTHKKYGLFIKSNSTTKRVYCPEYTSQAIISIDLLLNSIHRKIPANLLISNLKEFKFTHADSDVDILSKKLLKAVLLSLEGKCIEVSDDIKEGYDIIMTYTKEIFK